MGKDPGVRTGSRSSIRGGSAGWFALVLLAALVGLVLLVDASLTSSATYDEVSYLRVAARYWRTGDQSEITRMGSPLTFWKLQQMPVLWMLDRAGYGEWIDDPIAHQRVLLPVVRSGALWIWLVALALTALWARRCHGPRAMALAAWLFVLSPNLIAHGALVTMELPLVAAASGAFYLFWRFLESGRMQWFWASAALSGLAFSCKYTAALFPPILAALLWAARCHRDKRRLAALTRHVVSSMSAYVVIMILSNLVVTGFARLPLSTSCGNHPTLERWLGASASDALGSFYETPLPADWVGFATQLHHQASGGASYLCGERRLRGWWYYYFVALGVKVPLSFWLLLAGRMVLVRGIGAAGPREGGTPAGVPAHRAVSTNLLGLAIALFLLMTAAGSARNYGVRYLLPLAPLAIVWVSALAECRGSILPRLAVAAGVVGYVVALLSVHPHELVYFNALAGGPLGGRRILADSNLDWGQGLNSLASLQKKHPEFRDITLYYFGDTEPARYCVAGCCHVIRATGDQCHLPEPGAVGTRYLGVSASLQWGPWGPAGFFEILRGIEPVCYSDDTTIAIYRTSEVRRALASHQYMSAPRERRSSRPSASSATRRTIRSASRDSSVSTARFSMTTKYSSPRSTRMARWPSTMRALSFKRARQSRSLTGPHTETRLKIARPSASVPAGPTYTACFRSSRSGTTSCQPRPQGLAS
jgi:hypothetical protein